MILIEPSRKISQDVKIIIEISIKKNLAPETMLFMKNNAK